MSPDRFLNIWPEDAERPRRHQPLGSIEVHTGPMFSGKSDAIIAELRILKVRVDLMVQKGEINQDLADKLIMVFKPEIDDRRGKETINSQNGHEWPAIPILSSKEVLDKITKETGVVVFDEAQFFDLDLPLVVEELANRGVRVIVAGLDRDFRGEAFGPMERLMTLADEVVKHKAICACCGGENATRTQRVIVQENGERTPANYEDPIVLIGATESYEPRCRNCHEVPGKPEEW